MQCSNSTQKRVNCQQQVLTEGLNMYSRLYSLRQQNRGFTLMEMMITAGILSIIAAFAIPSYLGQITKGHRADAKVTLADTAQKLGRCFTEFNTYKYDADDAPTCPQSSDLNTAPNGSDYYDFEIKVTGGNTYEITATAKGQQLSRDGNCKTFSLTHLNEKTSTPSGDYKCW